MGQTQSKLRPPGPKLTRVMHRCLTLRYSLARLPVILLLVFAVHSVPGQSQSTTQPPPTKQEEQEIDPDDVISVNTAEVLLPVTVRDSAGLLVSNLTRKDFRVFEDGVEQPLSDLSLRQVPVDVVL